LVLISYQASRWNWIRKIRSSKEKTTNRQLLFQVEKIIIGMGGAAVSSADTGAVQVY
jgi:hypothetical protein